MKIKTKKFLGLVLALYAIPLLIVALSAYSVSAFLFAALGGGEELSYGWSIAAQVVQLFLTTVGILAVLGLPVGIPVGLILYFSARKQERAKTSSSGA